MNLTDRMTGYEKCRSTHLTRKVPVIVRVDGRAFHTFCRGLEKPFDRGFMIAMAKAAEELMTEMQGSVLAYIQSDEASFMLLDTAKHETMPWFDYRLEKVISIAASTMTAAFNKWMLGHPHFWPEDAPCHERFPGATFDARAFNVPMEDVANYFLGRAMDWHRNSVQMLARAHFSHKELYKKDQAAMIEMLGQRQIYWYDLDGIEKYGTYLYHRTNESRRLIHANYLPPCYPSVAGILEMALEGYNARVQTIRN